MECSWVKSDLLPKKVIEEYKKGITANVVFKSTSSCQQETTVVTIENSTDGTYILHNYALHLYKNVIFKPGARPQPAVGARLVS